MKLKKIFAYLMTVSSLLLSSCDDPLDVTLPQDFDVKTEKTTYRAGEEIEFKFTGNPNIITFYSGEVGNDYQFREGRVIPPGEVTLSFENRVIFGAQPDQLSVLVSTDFSGTRNIDAIKAASWTNITDRFQLATTDVYASSGTADLSDLVIDGKPLYLTFRYVHDPAKGTPRTWNVRNLALNSTTSLGTTTLATHLTGGFQLFYVGPKEITGRSSVASGRMALRSKASPNAPEYAEDWCLSSGFDLGTKDMGPDRPIKIKGNSDAAIESTSFTYSEPGTYKAYFVATNSTIKEQGTVVKEINIEITP